MEKDRVREGRLEIEFRINPQTLNVESRRVNKVSYLIICYI
jgi:hypothetical protein